MSFSWSALVSGSTIISSILFADALYLEMAQAITAGTIELPGRPYKLSINTFTNIVYASNVISDTLSVIDGLTNSVIANISVGKDPYGVSVNPSTNMVYVANADSDTLSVIDGSTNSVVTSIEVGDFPYGVSVNPSTNMVYVASWKSDTVSVIDGSTNSIVAEIETGDRPWGVTVNPITNFIYATNADSDTLSVIDGSTNSVADTIEVGDLPYGVSVNPSTNMIYVANTRSGTVSVIDGLTNSVIANISVGDLPYDVAVNPSTNMVYVALAGSNTDPVIDGSTNSVVYNIEVDDPSYAVSVNPSSNIVYFANAASNAVSVIDNNGLKSESFSASSSLDGKSYTITGLSESVRVVAFTINPEESVEIELDGQGEVELTLSTTMISGIHKVVSGKEEIAFEQISNTSSSATIKFTVPNNTDSVKIIGTTVVPEFSAIAVLILAVSLLVIVGFTTVIRRNVVMFSGMFLQSVNARSNIPGYERQSTSQIVKVHC